jgi:hypothetical protein
MKKILLTIACLLTSLAMVQAVTLAWGYDSTVTPSQDTSGAAIGYAVGSQWVVQLVEYDGGYAASGAGNVLASTTMGPSPLAAFKSASFSENVGDSSISVYGRIYNATTIGAATHYVNLGVNGGAGFYTTAAGGSTVIESMTSEGFSGISTPRDIQDRGTWVAIPEPGTIILFGLGGLIIAARKKFRK